MATVGHKKVTSKNLYSESDSYLGVIKKAVDESGPKFWFEWMGKLRNAIRHRQRPLWPVDVSPDGKTFIQSVRGNPIFPVQYTYQLPSGISDGLQTIADGVISQCQ